MVAPSFPQTVKGLSTAATDAAAAITGLQAGKHVTTTDAATYALTAADVDGIVFTSRATAVTIQVPQDLIPVGKTVKIIQGAAGAVTVDPQGSVLTINGSTSNLAATAAAYTTILLSAVAPNVLVAEVKAPA